MAKQERPNQEGSITFRGVTDNEVEIAQGWDDDGLKLTAGEASVLLGPRNPIRSQAERDARELDFQRIIRSENPFG